VRHLLDALKTGEPFHLTLSLGLGAFYEALGGPAEYWRGRRLIDLALRMAVQSDDAYLLAMVYTCWSSLDLLCGRVADGLAHGQTAESYLDKAGRYGRAWEQDTCNMMLVWFLGWGGRIRELSERLPSILGEGRLRGDLFADVAIRCFTTAHLVDLAADEPDRGIAEIRRAIGQWRQTQYDTQHLAATLSCVECHLYAGRAAEARQVLLADGPAIRKSMLLRKAKTFRTLVTYTQGRTALAEWLRLPRAENLRIETEQCAARLIRTGLPWGNAMGRLLRAGVMTALGLRREAVSLLRTAEEILREQDLRLLAAAALRRAGELEGEAGEHHVEAAEEFMRSEGILRPDRMTAMILPGL
jgi:hypothetical protein